MQQRQRGPDLNLIEQQLALGNFNAAANGIVAFIDALSGTSAFAGSPADVTAAYTRLAAAIANLFQAPDFRIEAKQFVPFCQAMGKLAEIFLASGFRTPDHVISLLATTQSPARKGAKAAPNQALIKTLLLQSVQVRQRVNFADLLRREPGLAGPALIGALAGTIHLDSEADAQRNRLLGVLADWADPQVGDLQVFQLANIYMNCSYATAEDRHRVKPTINAAVRRWMQGKGIVARVLPPSGEPVARPRLLLPLETITATHAMTRCYGRLIEQLREDFEVVAVVDPRFSDDTADALADRVLRLQGGLAGLKRLVDEINGLAPDLVYFPSVGMSDWALCLANLRLAPLQLATLGHPASTDSDAIDYMLMQRDLYGGDGIFSETVVLLDHHPLSLHPDLPETRHRPRDNPCPVRVAVASRNFKINSAFLRVLRAVRERAGRPVEWHFFTNLRGHEHHAMAAELDRCLEHVVCWEATDYPHYLARLADCDLQLQTFPFGGANSNVDGLLLGLPLVAMIGPQPHSRMEFALFEGLDFPRWLLSDDEAGYIDNAVRLIDDDGLRRQTSEAIHAQARRAIESPSPPGAETEFGATVRRLYAQHERLQGDGRKLWQADEL